MRAFASNWTRPFAMSRPGQPYEITDFDLFTTILSALEWRRHNGSICMITDTVGERYYRSVGLTDIWDDGILCKLDAIPYTIDPSTFWAAGKLFALSHVPAPCVMLDTDFIVWHNIQQRLSDAPLTVIHREALHPSIYPAPNAFSLDANYAFPQDWDWRQEACNTALACFGSEALRQRYLIQAFAFMRAALGRDSLIYMVFAEQRLLAMCAHAMGLPIQALSTPDALFSPAQQDFTHIWGFKQGMMENPSMREAFCCRCAHRLTTDFPQEAAVCSQIPVLHQYFL